MILVDSSVWIDYLRQRTTIETIALDHLIDTSRLATADLVLAEVLQGIRDEATFRKVMLLMSRGCPIVVANHRIAIDAARNYQLLRARGVTVRRTIDTLIATRCIVDNVPLLYSDRDFDPFVQHLGLRSALDVTGAT